MLIFIPHRMLAVAGVFRKKKVHLISSQVAARGRGTLYV